MGIAGWRSSRSATSIQSSLTVVAPIRPERIESIERELLTFDVDRFGTVASLHFARWVVAPPAKSPDPAARDFPPTLVFSTHYDGTEADQLEELAVMAPAELEAIYENCVGFDAQAGPREVRLRDYLKRHAEPHNAFYVGARSRSVQQIQREKRVVDCIRAFLARQSHPDRDLRTLRERIRQHVDGEIGGPHPIEPRRKLWAYRGLAVGLVGIFAMLIVLSCLPPWARFVFLLVSILLLVILIGALARLRVQEEQDAEVQASEERSSAVLRRRQEMEREEDLAEREDLGFQNELTTIVSVKVGGWRRILLGVVLAVGNVATTYYWNWTRGKLLGISTIHFAHWVMVDGGRRLIFFSNYDGSWASYLDDFVQHGARWLTAIWGQCVDFPRTRYLVYDGAADGPRFKAWARRTQESAEVWFSAYPELSLQEIHANTEIARGLWQEELDRFQLKEWLALL